MGLFTKGYSGKASHALAGVNCGAHGERVSAGSH